MKELWQDIRAHPGAILLLLALWVVSTTFFAAMPRVSGPLAPVMGVVGFYALRLPPFAAGVLIGWSRRTRGAPAGLVAALVVGTVLHALSQIGLALAGLAGASETPPPGPWGPLILRVFEVAVVVLVGLAASAMGWLLGRFAWRSRPPTPAPSETASV